jgi:hypothetical protein
MSSPSTFLSSFHRGADSGMHLNFYANHCCNLIDVAAPRMLEMIVAPVEYYRHINDALALHRQPHDPRRSLPRMPTPMPPRRARLQRRQRRVYQAATKTCKGQTTRIDPLKRLSSAGARAGGQKHARTRLSARSVGGVFRRVSQNQLCTMTARATARAHACYC